MAAGGVVDVYMDVWGGGTGGCIHEVGLIQGRRGEYIFMYEVVLYIYMCATKWSNTICEGGEAFLVVKIGRVSFL